MTYDAGIIRRFNDETAELKEGEYWLETLKDDTPILIRELRESNREQDLAFLNTLGKDTPHFRFLASFSDSVEGMHDQLMDVSHHNRMAFVALVHEGGQIAQIGTARYGAYEGDAHCEFAVAVSERWQRKGVASLLIQHLMDTATRRGFNKISSMDSANNQAMEGLAKSLGFTSRVDQEHEPRIFRKYVLS
ncbi:GNAT family N-acetyltransferase [Pseudomonas sp. R1-18]|uniref:GNAT family N-acetyltransferase n=1 Tax=Pseudomonas sp. R1-18 TaxID=1632772 RepID=UPI003DA95B8F